MLLSYPDLVQTLTTGSTQDITKTVIDLRERIEVLHTSEYNEFLQRLYPVLHGIITQRTKPQFSDNDENKCRHAILDLLYRFPHNEVLKPVVDNFLNMVMPVFADDNEENALTALRIIFDLHKAYRPILESHAQPFLEQVQKILKNMPSAVKVLFTNLRPTSQPGGSQLGKGPAASVHTSAQSMPGAIAVPVAPPSSSLGTQLSTPSMGSAVNSMSASRSVDHTSSVASQASNALLLSSNTYLLGGTAAGAGVTSPMATNAIAAESKEDLKIMRSVSAPEVVQSDNQPLLLSQGNFSHSMQPSQGSVMGPGLSQPQMMRSMSGSPFRPESGSMEVAPGSASQAHLQRAQFMSLTRSIDSFRVLAECPLIVMLLFQLYPKFQKYIPGIVPLMMQALSLSPVTVTSAFRAKYKELIAAQVKTLSLLTYLLRNFENRQFAESTRPNEDAIARNVVALLRNCPTDIVSTRKEILVAIRHILNTNDFKKGFYSYADLLLDEKLLLGQGRTTNAVLRPMAYSTIADLVNHIKDSLTLAQLTKIVYSFSQNLHDPDLSLPVQTTCVRVLFNVAERLSYNFKDSNPELPTGRALLLHVVRVVINKFGAMRRYVNRLDSHLYQTPNDGDQAELGAAGVFVDLCSQFQAVVVQKKEAMKDVASEDVVYSVSCAAAVSIATSGVDGESMEFSTGTSNIELDVAVTSKQEDPNTMSVYSLLRKTSGDKSKRLGISSSVVNSAACALFLGQAQSADPVREIKQLLKTMLPGLKSMLLILSKSFATSEIMPSQSQQPQYKTVPLPLSDAEEALLSRFMCWTLECCFALKMRSISVVVKSDKAIDVVNQKVASMSDAKLHTSEVAGGSSTPTDNDIRELLDQLASAFTVIEPHHLRPVLAANLQKIYDYAVENQVFLSVIQQLLSYPHTAAVALDTMLSFFLSKIYDLSFQTINTSSSAAYSPSGYVTINGFSPLPAQSGDVLIFGSSCLVPPALPIYPNYSAAPSSSASFISSAKTSLRHGVDESDKLKVFKGQRASTLLRLFKMVLGSVKSFPEIEKTLRPWLKSLITTCLKCAHECRISVNYLFVLRYLFMTISGGKFDLSYNEILPLFPLLLNSFNKLLCRTDHLIVQNVLLELCLTIPSRLASLSQHLPVLLHLLARALGTKGELPNLALRTLEFWVEHLNADCLHTAMTSKQGLMKDILSGICSHLKPAPYPYGMLALRVLGKLGGRNRNLAGMHNIQLGHHVGDLDELDSGEMQTAENCTFPTARDKKSAVHMFVRKFTPCQVTKNSHNTGNDENTEVMDIIHKVDEDAKPQSEGIVYGIGLDSAIFRACELLDRLCTRSTAAESEVPSLLLASVAGLIPAEAESSRISDATYASAAVTDSAMDVVEENEINSSAESKEDQTMTPPPYSLDIRKLRNIPDFFQTLLPSIDDSADSVPVIASRLHSIADVLLQKTDTVDAITPSIHKLLSREIREMNLCAVNVQKKNSMRLIVNAAYSILGNIVRISPSDLQSNVKVAVMSTADSENSMSGIVNSDVLSRIILAVVATFEDPVLKDEARSFLVGICTHLALYLLSTENKSSSQTSCDVEIDDGHPGYIRTTDLLWICVHRAVMAAFEDPRDAMYKAGFWLLNVWIVVNCQVKMGQLSSLECFESLISSHQFNVDLNKLVFPACVNALYFPAALTNDLIARTINNCLSSKWNNRVAALRMLSELCCRLPSGWCMGRETELVKSVFDMLKQSGLVLMVSAALDASTVLKKLCVSCHGIAAISQKSTPTASFDAVPQLDLIVNVGNTDESLKPADPALLVFLVLSTFEGCMLVRISAKLYLKQIAAALNCTLSDMLASIKAEISQNILPHFINKITSLSIEDKTGLMAGVSFLLSLPGFIGIDDLLFRLLNDGMKALDDIKEVDFAPPDFAVRHTCPIVPPSVGITDWGDKSLNEYFSLRVLCLPSDIPIMVEFRLHLIHLIEAFHTHSSQIMLGEEQSIVDLRLKCFVLLFKSLVTHWDEVKTTAQTAVNSIISSFKNASGGKSENALPKQVMNECLQPLFGAIQDSRRLSLSTLKSLGVILKIVMHKFYVQFGDKFLSHLKHWLDPEKIMNPPIWAPGEEVIVAATMMDLFHVLPWIAAQPQPSAGPGAVTPTAVGPSVLHSFFEQYVQMTIKLESVRSKYKHPFMLDSPFLAPMSKFLYKFPNEGVIYFLDPRNIANPGVIRLLLQILKYSSVAAHPFLDKLSSPDAIAILRKNLLTPALPLSAPSQQVSAERPPIATIKIESNMAAMVPGQSVIRPVPVVSSGSSGTVPVVSGSMSGGEPVAKRQRTDSEVLYTSSSQIQPQALSQAPANVELLQHLSASLISPNTGQPTQFQAQSQSQLQAMVPSDVYTQPQSSLPVQPALSVNVGAASDGFAANSSPSSSYVHSNSYLSTSADQSIAALNLDSSQAFISSAASSSNVSGNTMLIGPPLLSQNSARPIQPGQGPGIASSPSSRAFQQGGEVKPVLAASGATTTGIAPIGISSGSQPAVGQKRSLNEANGKPAPVPTPLSPGWSPESFVNGLKLLHHISCIFPKIYESNSELTSTLRQMWKVLLHRKLNLPDEVISTANSSAQSFITSGEPMIAHPSSRVGFRRNIAIHKALRLLTRCLLIVFNFNPDNVDILFDMLPILSTQLVFDVTFFTEFLRLELPSRYSIRVRRNIIRRFLDVCRDPRRSLDVKVKGWQLIFIPIFLDAFQNKNGIAPNQIFDTELVETIMQQVLIFGGVVSETTIQRSGSDGAGNSSQTLQAGDINNGNQKFVINDSLRIELLKISTLLIENFGAHLVSCRKDVIKFAWNNLKSEDVTTKHWGYVLICRFMATFETPSKIIFQVFFALLRIHQHEGRDLIRLALDILVPILPDRLKSDELLKAMRYTKKIAVEEGHSLPQLIHLWHIIIRHSDIFYPFRSYFIQLMVQSIARLGLTGTCPLDQRQVSVGIADVMVEWEWFRQQKNVILGVKLDASPTASKPLEVPVVLSTESKLEYANEDAKSADGFSVSRRPNHQQNSNSALEKELDFSLYSSLVPILANFLVRLGLYGAEGKEPAMYRLSTKCLGIFRKMVQLVPMKSVRMTYFDRYFITTVESLKPRSSGSGSASASNKNSMTSSTASDRSLETFLLLLSCGLECVDGPSPLFVNNVVPLKDLILAITTSNDYPKAQKAFRDLVVVVLKIYPPSQPTAVLSDCGFYHKLKDSTDKCLRKYATMKGDFFRVSNTVPDKSPAASSGSSVTGDDNVLASQKNLMSSLLSLLRLLDVICIQTPDWVDNHGSAFTKLGQKLISDHIDVAASNLRSGLVAMAGSLQEHGQNIETSKVQPTPHMALIAESMRGYPLSAYSPSTGANSGGSTPPPVSANILASPDDATHVLMISMNIMCRGVSTQHLADQKEVVVNLMLTVLESSDCIVLLGLVVDYFDKWVGRHLSPLSLKSQYDIVSKLDNLDRLSEVLTQVLISRLVAISERISITTLDLVLLPPPPPQPVNALGAPQPAIAKQISPSTVLPRAIDVFGLMSSHDELRKISTERAVKVWGAPLYERFLGIFRADLRLHVNRFWPAILPSIFFNCSDLTGCSRPMATQSMPDDISLPIFISNTHSYHTFLQAAARSASDSEVSTFYEDMLECISNLSMTSVDACSLWKSFLHILWSDLALSNRAVLTNSMCENIAKHQYRQNLYWPSKIYGPISGGDSGSSCVKICPSITPANVPQSLLRAFLSLEPRPLIPIEFLGAIGAHYGTWNDSCEVLESIVFSEKPNALVKQSAFRTLLSLYNDVGDQDSMRILSRLFSDRTSTDIALSLDNYDLPQISQCVVWKGLRECNAVRTEKHASNDALSSVELEIWETRWVESAKALSQWDVLYHHADKLQMSHVAIEAAAMRSDWDAVKKLRYSPSVVACLEMGIPTFKLFDIMQCVLENRFAEADRLCALTVQMALFRWQLLPPVATGCNAHHGLLHLFHRVIELRESTGMIMEVAKIHTENRSELPDLKGMIETWRERLPDPRDNMYMWDTLLLWRTHVFQMIQNAVRNVHDASLLAALHDTPWTVTKLAHAANKRGLPDSCLLTLSKLDSISAMDIPDCYNKLREQILVCLKSEKQWNAGLNIINSTNLEFFDWMQKSELFRLKAVFQDMLGLTNESNTTFSQSVQICLSNGKGWYSWGEFCYKLFRKERTTENAVSAMVPILKAVECNYDLAKPLLSRVLYLLATEDDILTLGNAFQFCLSTMPEWVWIPHIPQLLEATRRHESNFVKPVLCRIAEKYPQAIYNHLAYFASEPNTTFSGDLHSGLEDNGSNVEFFRMRTLVAVDVLDIISRSHKSYYHKATSIYKNIANSLGKSRLEIVCSILIITLQSVVDDLSIRWASGTLPGAHHVLTFVRRIQLAFSCPDQTRLFEAESAATITNRLKISNMERDFKNAFQWVFDVAAEDGVISTTDISKQVPDCEGLVNILCIWIQRLETKFSSTFGSCSLTTLSRPLADIFLETNLISRGNGANIGYEDIEIPGAFQGCWDYRNEPSVNLHTKLVRFSPIVKMVKLNSGKFCRRLTMIGNDGELYNFAVLQTSDKVISSMINFSSICEWVNNGLRLSTDAFQRDAEFRQLQIIPIEKGLCLLRVQHDSFALSEALDLYLSKQPVADISNKQDALVYCRRLFEQNLKNANSCIDGLYVKLKGEVYDRMSRIMPSDALRRRIRQYCPTPDLYSGRAKSFASQIGLHSAMSVFLNGSNEFNPENIIFSCSEDSVFLTGLHRFSKTGFFDSKPCGINFRLTKNICGALSPVLVLGSMTSSMGCLLNTLVAHRSSLEPLLCLILLESERISASLDKISAITRAKNAFDYVEDVAPKSQDISRLIEGVNIFSHPAAESMGECESNESTPIDVHVMRMTRDAGDLNSLFTKDLSWMPWL